MTDWKEYYRTHREKILERMHRYRQTDKYKLYDKHYRETHRKYYRDYNRMYAEKRLGSYSTERIYSEENKDKELKLLETEVNRIRNYSKRSRKNGNADEDYNHRDYALDHNYYTEDYTSVEHDYDNSE